MKLARPFAVPLFLLCAFTATVTFLSASSQEMPAPNISGMSVQGGEVSLSEFKGDKNILVVFYRMHT